MTVNKNVWCQKKFRLAMFNEVYYEDRHFIFTICMFLSTLYFYNLYDTVRIDQISLDFGL